MSIFDNVSKKIKKSDQQELDLLVALKYGTMPSKEIAIIDWLNRLPEPVIEQAFSKGHWLNNQVTIDRKIGLLAFRMKNITSTDYHLTKNAIRDALHVYHLLHT